MGLLAHLWFACLVLADQLMGMHLVEWEAENTNEERGNGEIYH